ncbi:MAG TPA: glycosyltransferase family 39 protein [Stellaceae bacterium]|jgi:4-amino-4-deoxy-L-arabinose transferase-like glycosyltransferase|nr:glycosyltransferase family 39 protein [Stellaceae bacterium]
MIERALLGWRPYALLLLLCFGLYLPGLVNLPVTDRDEARFAQATRQMLETRDFIAIRFQDEARNKKPAGIYWLQAAAVAAFSDPASDAIWPYRLPSLLGATAASLLSFGMGARLVGRKAAFIGAALLAGSLGLGVEAHLAKTDAVLLACIAATQLALARIYLDARAGIRAPLSLALLFWAALAAGILIKGPVAPLVALLTIAALAISDRRANWLRDLRPVAGVALLAVIVLPWLIAISTATQGAFLSDSLGQDFLGKLIGAQESHGAPPLFYLALLIISFWPGTLFLGPAIAWGWAHRRADAERFLIAWGVPFWIVLELVPTKLPNYLLPVYPALALMIGRALVAAGEEGFASWRRLDRIVIALWTLASLGLAAAFALVPLRYGPAALAPGVVAALIVLYLGQRAIRRAWRHAEPGLAIGAVIMALLVLALGFEFVAPSLDALWLSRTAAALVASVDKAAGPPLAVAGDAEPSLVFLLGTGTKLASAESAADYLAATPDAHALVETRSQTAFLAALAAHHLVPQALGTVAGLDYSNGHGMRLTLYGSASR